MESKDNSASADEQTSPSQFCQEVGSVGDCPKCSICKKRLARKSEYTVSECMEAFMCFCAHHVIF